jgi:hypothetical protein
MQILYRTGLTAEQYTQQRAWEQAKLDCCPFHPEGGCTLAKHGTYPRKFPEYCLIARWYCPKAHQSISLLPDAFACRFPGTLTEVEEVVNTAESSLSSEQAAAALRPEITLTSALRWLRRRIKHVYNTLTTVKGIVGSTCPPVLKLWRKHYSTTNLLLHLRILVADHLHAFPPILGFGPRPKPRYFTKQPSNNRWGLSSPV